MPAPHSISLPVAQPPLDWPWLCAFFQARAIAGVECVHEGAYLRTAALPWRGEWLRGWLRVRVRGGALQLDISPQLYPVRAQIVRRVRQQFDLDCNHAAVAAALGPLARPWPGLRVPGAFDGFETVVRGILGQQITVAAASTIAGRLAGALGTPLSTPFESLTHVFPSAPTLAAAAPDTLGRLGIVRTRVAAIGGLARACAQGELTLAPGVDVPATMRALRSIHGIGDWTAQYAAMRALGWADAFPAGDYAILKALGVSKPGEARARAESWRPWRAYAAICLWRSL